MQQLYSYVSRTLGQDVGYVLFSIIGWGIGIVILPTLRTLF